MAKASDIHSSLFGRQVRPMQFTAADVTDAIFGELRLIGIDVAEDDVRGMLAAAGAAPRVFGMDAAPDLQPIVGSASMGVPRQFLQSWLPGFVNILTAARKIDEIVGIQTVGSWEDEEIVQGALENTGLAQPYGDHNPAPLASWNVNFERRSIVRFEQGFEVGTLEERRSAKMKVNTAAVKRNGSAIALEIQRNRIGFYGYNGGVGRTYGFFNDPGLPAYSNVAAGVGGLPWSVKTALEIVNDVRQAMGALQAAAQGNFDPRKMRSTLAIPSALAVYLTVLNDFGLVVEEVLKKMWPLMRVVDAPELTGANGGANVFYLFIDQVADGVSDDDGNTWGHMVPTKFMTLGVEKRLKTYVEDYTNATAGVMVKRPYAVVRRSGI